jgi:Fur family transcriptional regulator, peroxide stress response regulator
MARPPRTRAAIATLVGDSDRHDWSIEELRAELIAGGGRADFSTVFRAVEALVAESKLRRVELGTPEARFEAATHHHEHVRCDGCGAVSAVDSCAVESAIPQIERSTGFALTGHNLVFHGLCPACRVAS